MIRLFLIVAAGLWLSACSDTFNPPPLPDLGKTPYDFSFAVPPFTGDLGRDMHTGGGGMVDMGTTD